MWFNDDDDLDDDQPLDAAAHPNHALDAIGKIVEKKVCSSTDTVNGPSRVLLSTAPSKPAHTDVQVSTPRLLNKGLVDYDGDSDEEEEGAASTHTAAEERDAKRPRLA